MTIIHPHRQQRRVYCAGPLFNAAERREMHAIAAVLREADFEPFVPHADGMEFAQVQPYLISLGHEPRQVGQWLHEAVFALDTYQVIVGCGSLVFNMNGRVPDEGAVAEATMAWMLGKPVVLFKEDARSAIAGRDNPLLVGQAGFETVREMELLGSALRRRVAEVNPDGECALPCPLHLQTVLAAGERLWGLLQSLGTDRPNAQVAEMVLSLFGSQELAGSACSTTRPANCPR